MFTNAEDRPMGHDIVNMVERPAARVGLREDQSRALALIEDPIEFGQNVARTLRGHRVAGCSRGVATGRA